MKKLLTTLCLLLAMPVLQAQTSTSTSTLAPLPLQASTLAQTRFNPQDIKGKVTIVFFWSTACAVCRDSLPELRANQAGWKDKPFALVTVNVDKKAEDWQAYERILARTIAPTPGLIALRQDANLPVPDKLPLTLLLDSKGKLVSRYEGRLAPEAWDAVADLMP
jgi:cytochrome oxidase Cu insertion factor (SCO1/SenC/PrrC family)